MLPSLHPSHTSLCSPRDRPMSGAGQPCSATGTHAAITCAHEPHGCGKSVSRLSTPSETHLVSQVAQKLTGSLNHRQERPCQRPGNPTAWQDRARGRRQLLRALPRPLGLTSSRAPSRPFLDLQSRGPGSEHCEAVRLYEFLSRVKLGPLGKQHPDNFVHYGLCRRKHINKKYIN